MCNIYFIVYSANSEKSVPTNGSIPFCLPDPSLTFTLPTLVPESPWCDCQRASTVTDWICHRPSHLLFNSHTDPLTTHFSMIHGTILPSHQWSSLKTFSLSNKADARCEGKGVTNRDALSPVMVPTWHPAAVRSSSLSVLFLWLVF